MPVSPRWGIFAFATGLTPVSPVIPGAGETRGCLRVLTVRSEKVAEKAPSISRLHKFHRGPGPEVPQRTYGKVSFMSSVRDSSQTVEQHRSRPKSGVRVIEYGRRAVSLEPSLSGYARCVGRVGALAVALGVGAAIASMPVAFATTGSEGSTGSSSDGSSSTGSTTGSGSGGQRFLDWRLPPPAATAGSHDECDGQGIGSCDVSIVWRPPRGRWLDRAAAPGMPRLAIPPPAATAGSTASATGRGSGSRRHSPCGDLRGGQRLVGQRLRGWPSAASARTSTGRVEPRRRQWRPPRSHSRSGSGVASRCNVSDRMSSLGRRVVGNRLVGPRR